VGPRACNGTDLRLLHFHSNVRYADRSHGYVTRTLSVLVFFVLFVQNAYSGAPSGHHHFRTVKCGTARALQGTVLVPHLLCSGNRPRVIRRSLVILLPLKNQ